MAFSAETIEDELPPDVRENTLRSVVSAFSEFMFTNDSAIGGIVRATNVSS